MSKDIGNRPRDGRYGLGRSRDVAGAAAPVAHGTIRSSPRERPGNPVAPHLSAALRQILARYQPDAISLEKVFFARNAQSALKLGQARGVALFAAAETAWPLRIRSPRRSK